MRVLILLLVFALAAHSEDAREIHLFVALADNASQGIIPVPAKIGNGDDPANNLYWGCSEGVRSVFSSAAEWKKIFIGPGPEPYILERLVLRHRSGKFVLTADAYRGSAIRECTRDFFAAFAAPQTKEQFPLAAYIGHDGLMDFPLQNDWLKEGPGREAIVLCCISETYFSPPLRKMNAQPLLMTTQLMYPGAFILKAALDGWIAGENAESIRARAAASYAANQRISKNAALGVFARQR